MEELMNPDERQAWRRFRSVNIRLLEHLDQELQRRSRLSLTDFEILTVLAESTHQRARMSEVADRVMVSRSRLTYRIDRLERLGLVRREECQVDRRGLFAQLTDEGLETITTATPGHLADIRAWFMNSMDTDELTRMDAVMRRLDANLPSV